MPVAAGQAHALIGIVGVRVIGHSREVEHCLSVLSEELDHLVGLAIGIVNVNALVIDIRASLHPDAVARLCHSYCLLQVEEGILFGTVSRSIVAVRSTPDDIAQDLVWCLGDVVCHKSLFLTIGCSLGSNGISTHEIGSSLLQLYGSRELIRRPAHGYARTTIIIETGRSAVDDTDLLQFHATIVGNDAAQTVLLAALGDITCLYDGYRGLGSSEVLHVTIGIACIR